jgi:hypothetical protein
MADDHTPTDGNGRDRKGLAADRFHLLFKKSPLVDELAIGGPAIAKLLFGNDDKETIRATYYLLESSNSVPSGKLGARWWVRPSTVRAKWWLQEAKAFQEADEELLAKTHILLSAIMPLLVEVCNGALDAEKALHLAHGVDEVTLVIEQLLRVKRETTR